MRVLVLSKMDDHDHVVNNFAEQHLSGDYELFLLNIVSIPSEIPLKMNGEVIDVCTEYNLSKYYDHQKKNQEQLHAYLTNCNVTERSAKIGDPLHIVKWFVKENNIDLVVSGGHVTSHSEDVFSKSFSHQLMQQLSVPYLSVKNENVTQVKVNTIAVVREFVDPAKRNLEFINKVQAETGAKILLVKLNTPNSHMEAAELKTKMDQFAQLNGLNNFEQVTIEASDKETAIKDLIQKHNVDLLTLGHLHRNGISSFLRGDLRSDVLNHINIPIYMY
jgi:nucleotide-binding universal stress UspA family protein